MSRIPTPATIEAHPPEAQPLLQAVKKQLGVVPNLFRLVANSPAALEGYVGMFGALGKGARCIDEHAPGADVWRPRHDVFAMPFVGHRQIAKTRKTSGRARHAECGNFVMAIIITASIICHGSIVPWPTREC